MTMIMVMGLPARARESVAPGELGERAGLGARQAGAHGAEDLAGRRGGRGPLQPGVPPQPRGVAVLRKHVCGENINEVLQKVSRHRVSWPGLTQ